MSTHRSAGFADVLVGLQYGDEGKAKIIDLLAGDYDCIARFNGGANAGHTIETDRGRISVKQIPSGVFYDGMRLYIGSGCVVDAVKLVEEIRMLSGLGIDVRGRLAIAARAALVQPHHIVIDKARFGSIGTTRNGIGAAYADRALRMDGDRLVSIRISDVIANTTQILDIIARNLEATLALHRDADCNVSVEITKLREALPMLAEYVQADSLFMTNFVRSGGRVLFEGAQSTALDVAVGTVPFVTSSHTVAAAAFVGGDLSTRFHRQTIGVAKAIMSRVGIGPFVSEYGGVYSEQYCNATNDGQITHSRETEAKLDTTAELSSDDPFRVGRALRILSGEYGTGTQRPRRIGMLDLVQLRRAVAANGVNALYITKCDLLHHYARTIDRTLPIVTDYQDGGHTIDYEPASEAHHRRLAPVVTRLQAPSAPLKHGKTCGAIRSWLDVVQVAAGCRIAGVGTGPERAAVERFESD